MSIKENKVCLYIFTHNKTGLKYFGKTKRCFTIESLLKYGGSGKYWKYHLKKHGKDISVEIYGIYDINEVEEIAINFSKENDIVNAINESGNRIGKKVWANEKYENGLDGGFSGKDSHRKSLSKRMKEQNKSEIFRKKFSEAKKGHLAPKALTIEIYDENNKLQNTCIGNFKAVCINENYPFAPLRASYQNGGKRIFNTNKSYKESISRKEDHFKGWYAIKIE